MDAEKLTLVQVSEPSLLALIHIFDSIERSGSHSVTSCPSGTRGMCPHKDEVESLRSDGWKWPTPNDQYVDQLRELRSFLRSQCGGFYPQLCIAGNPYFGFLSSEQYPEALRDRMRRHLLVCDSWGEAADIVLDEIQRLTSA